MSLRTEIREVEKHIKSMTPNKPAQIAIASKAQSMVLNDKHSLTVLVIVKNRIIHS